jgi:transcriptional regulator with XRE-family HTH domain
MRNPLKWIGKELKQFRHEINKSLKQIAMRCNKKSTAELSRIENGKQNASIATLMRYLNKYGYTLIAVQQPNDKTKINKQLRELLKHYSEQEIFAIWYERRKRKRR